MYPLLLLSGTLPERSDHIQKDTFHALFGVDRKAIAPAAEAVIFPYSLRQYDWDLPPDTKELITFSGRSFNVIYMIFFQIDLHTTACSTAVFITGIQNHMVFSGSQFKPFAFSGFKNFFHLCFPVNLKL